MYKEISCVCFPGREGTGIFKGNIFIYEIYKIYNINVAGESTNDKILLKEGFFFICLVYFFQTNRQMSVNYAVGVRPNLGIFVFV